MKTIYLDHHATTPMDSAVFEAMKPYFMEDFGNAASRNHSYGWSSEKAVETARTQIAKSIGAISREIVFTSGATESNNLALLGIAEGYKDQGRHIVTTQVEHKSILDTCKELETRGFKITYLPVDSFGQVVVDSVRDALTSETILVSVQMANNEVGSIQPIKEIGAVLKEREIFFHSDITQALSTLPVSMNELNLDLASFTAHKIYGPKGIGALFVHHKSPRIKLKPLIFGGGHEKGLRSGTLNVPGIVGFGKACELISDLRAQDYENLKMMRDELEETLKKSLKIKVNGHPTDRLPHNLNFRIDDVNDINELLKGLPDLAMSTGAACSVNSIDPSHVLTAMGLTETQISQTLRIGLGRMSSPIDCSFAAKSIIDVVSKLPHGQKP